MEEKARTPWQLTRLLMVLCWLLWILTFFITVTLFQAVLQIHVVSQVVQNVEKGFIRFNEDLIRATPLDVVGHAQLDEMLLRYYLEMRYTVVPDRAEMERRWGERGIVAFLSSPAVYKEFKPAESEFERMDNTHPRVIDILKTERKGTYYSVDVDLYRFDGATKWVKSQKRFVVQFSYSPSRRYFGRTWSNPQGFVVTRVDESDRKSTTQ